MLLLNTANKNGNNIFGKKVATNQAKEINKKYNSQIQAVKTTIQQTQKPTSTRVEQADDAIEVEPVVITPDIMQLAKDCKLDEVKDRIKASCNSSNNTGNGLTWSASICNKSIELLQTVLLCPGLDVNWANESNWTALDYACQLRDLEDHSQKVTVLEAAGGKKLTAPHVQNINKKWLQNQHWAKLNLTFCLPAENTTYLMPVKLN